MSKQVYPLSERSPETIERPRLHVPHASDARLAACCGRELDLSSGTDRDDASPSSLCWGNGCRQQRATRDDTTTVDARSGRDPSCNCRGPIVRRFCPEHGLDFVGEREDTPSQKEEADQS